MCVHTYTFFEAPPIATKKPYYHETVREQNMLEAKFSEKQFNDSNGTPENLTNFSIHLVHFFLM